MAVDPTYPIDQPTPIRSRPADGRIVVPSASARSTPVADKPSPPSRPARRPHRSKAPPMTEDRPNIPARWRLTTIETVSSPA